MAFRNIIRALIFATIIFTIGEVSCQRIVFEEDGEGSNGVAESCPQGFRCRPTNQCRLSSLGGAKPQQCGPTDSWRSRICCPDRKRGPSATTARRPPGTRPNTNRRNSTTKSPVRPNPPAELPRTPINSPPSADSECGKATWDVNREGFVIGGENAEQGAWPWAVAITRANRRRKQIPWCTGFLIDRRHAISAAHCFDRRQVNLYTARIGHVDQTFADVYNIEHIAIPDNYIIDNIYNDVAVLTLSRGVDTPNFTPVCLPTSSEYRNMTGMGTTVIGWGSTRLGGPMSLILKQLSAMPVVSNYVCEQAYRERLSNFATQFYRGLPRSILCAGFLDEPGKDSCGGDSGGPLMIQEYDRWYAIGIVGFGYLCGRPGLAGGYTRVSEYLDWINRNRNT